ncbi:XRE family transcriptional regulator [Kribbella flavida]|uniref:XRE family transcriptional regulator n=1 Tax=Kribbella flavida TaxID=182640 RepID=UPI00019BE035|nr:XRE family transcriptional regulator [Kribbella flavida]
MSTPPFAHLLRHLRTTAGLTQERLAERSGLSPQAIGALEGGRRQYPRPTTVAQLADALSLSPEDRHRLTTAAHRPKAGDPASAVPRQLPPPITDFTGRTTELDTLVALLRAPHAAAPGIVISAIGGMAGIGKTTLAVQAAHRVADVFPDGQLYLNLRGGGRDPVRPVDALAALLLGLGVPPSGDPQDERIAAARFRTAMAGRRMLVVLDDAAGIEQVTPLLPGTPSSAVVITSRRRLTALPGVRHVDLDLLTEHEALQLLGEVVGPEWVEAAPNDARRIVQRCGHLPLAIRIAGGQVRGSSDGAGTLGGLAERLTGDADRLGLLDGPQASVRASIAVSIGALIAADQPLDLAAAQAFPWLSLLDGNHFSLRVASAVLELPLQRTEEVLERLVDIQLLETPALHRYRMHDLVRAVGREQAKVSLTPTDLAGAQHRELAQYAAMLWRLEKLRGEKLRSYAIASGAEEVTDLGEAAAWLESELANMVRLVRAAAATWPGERHLVASIALGLRRFSSLRMRFAEPRDALQAVVERLTDEDPDELTMHLLVALGQMNAAMAQYEQAAALHRRALPLVEARGDVLAMTNFLIDLSYFLGRASEPAAAIEYAERALALAPEAGSPRAVPLAHLVVGTSAGGLGDIDRQRSAFERATQLIATTPGPARAMYLSQIGWSLAESGQFDTAVEVLTDGLEAAQGNETGVVGIDLYLYLGRVWLALDHHADAIEAFTIAGKLAAECPAEGREPMAHHELGRAHAALGNHDQARDEWQRAATLYDRIAAPAADEVRALLAGLDGGDQGGGASSAVQR